MANTKSTKTKATTTVSETTESNVASVSTEKTTEKKKEFNVLDVINETVDNVSENGTGSSKEKSRTTTASVPLDEEIAVRSITFGGLTWISNKTNSHYRWNEIGAVEYITFAELITLNNTKRAFLFDPLVIIQDERVVKYFRLESVYEKVAQINELENVFNSGDMSKVISVLNTIKEVNMRDVAISRIRHMRENGSLTNIDVIRQIETILCFDLSNKD